MAEPLFDRRAYPHGSTFSYMTMADGWRLRRFDWPVAGVVRGSILFQVGRGDMPEKYLESFAHWHSRGWNVTAVDWRGQGGSGRIADDPTTGHIDDFATWVADLKAIWPVWRDATPGPHILMGHSMGGHLALRAVAEGAVDPDAFVLIAPMLGFSTSVFPVGLVAGLVRLAARIWPQRKAWPDNERPAPPQVSRQFFLTHDADRYADEQFWRDTVPELVLGPPSLGWLSAAYASTIYVANAARLEKVTQPGLIVGTDGDRLVSPVAIRKVASMLPNARIKMFGEGVAHEILREVDAVRDETLALIDGFLDEVAPAR